jgi:hypothetical protein
MVVTSRHNRLSAANIISVVTMIVVGIIVLGIVFVLLKANQQNMIVNWFVDAGSWLTTPFHDIFNPRNARQETLLNWGLAAIVYGLIGGFLSRVIHA